MAGLDVVVVEPTEHGWQPACTVCGWRGVITDAPEPAMRSGSRHEDGHR